MEKVNLNRVQDISGGLTTLVMFVKHNYKSLFKVFVYYLAVPILLVSILMAVGMRNYFTFFTEFSSLEPGAFPAGVDEDNPLSLISYMFPTSFFFSFILSILLNILFTAVVYRYVQLYNHSPDGVINIKDIQDNLGVVFLKFALIFFILFILLIISSFLFLGPGIFLSSIPIMVFGFIIYFIFIVYFSVSLSPIFIVSLEENLGVGSSMQRCFTLIQDRWWQTAIFLFLTFIIFFFASSLIQSPITMITFVGPIIGMENMALILGLSLVVSMILNYIVNTFIYIATAIWYYNLREGREGTSLIQSIDQIGTIERRGKAWR